MTFKYSKINLASAIKHSKIDSAITMTTPYKTPTLTVGIVPTLGVPGLCSPQKSSSVVLIQSWVLLPLMDMTALGGYLWHCPRSESLYDFQKRQFEHVLVSFILILLFDILSYSIIRKSGLS